MNAKNANKVLPSGLSAWGIAAVWLVLTATALWLSTQYYIRADWTATGRNTLSEASEQVLATLDGPLEVTAYARVGGVLRKSIASLVDRYRNHKENVQLEFIDPDTASGDDGSLDAQTNGTLVLKFGDRKQTLNDLNEYTFTNALHRLTRDAGRWIAYVEGHGERSLLGEANHDLGAWGAQLRARGYQISALNLARSQIIPDNTSILLLSTPQVELLAPEIAMLEEYVARGGNLLWLSDPGPQRGLQKLARAFGAEFVPGSVNDPTAKTLGLDDPRLLVVTQYTQHAVLKDFNMTTLFPDTVALKKSPVNQGWQIERLLESSAQSFTTEKTPSTEPPAARGPLSVGLTMTRKVANRTQRVALLGDGDFLSNAYLGNGGNAALGLSLIDWLGGDDALIAIPTQRAIDAQLTLHEKGTYALALTALFGLPALSFAFGAYVWAARKRR